MTLPKAFIDDIQPYLSSQEMEDFVHALTETEQTTCLRYNRAKCQQKPLLPIPWNPEDGAYLDERPNFTLDPLMHAGCFYVQEASSQFITHIIRHLVKEPVTALDLCAAPGGKSTAMLSALPEGSQLVSNEIDHRRARILAENITKWGNPNVTVTGNAPKDFSKLHNTFDLILTDVPCSGEGMFRKDEGAVKDWSPTKVQGCVSLQHEILDAIWPTLKSGGLLIYGTCTFNVHEDEEMLSYICEELGGEALSVPVEECWHIHPPLIGEQPCYRFMPHYTKGEGLFMAVIHKKGEFTTKNSIESVKPKNAKRDKAKGKAPMKPMQNIDLKALSLALLPQLECEATLEATSEGTVRAIPTGHRQLHDALLGQNLFILQSGIEMGTIKGRDIIPAHALALSNVRKASAFPIIEVNLDTALNYLRHEAITLDEEAPRGYAIISYQGKALGFVKNLGNRSNNLYPQEWRIRFL